MVGSVIHSAMPVLIQHAIDSEIPAGMKRLFVKSYGCQMNVYDGLRMAELMKPHGYALTDTYDGADLVVLNTCHIREKADEKVFSDIGRMKKVTADDAIIAVGGCTGQALGADIFKRAQQVQVVFGPQSMHRLPEFVERATRHHGLSRIVDTELPELQKFDALPTPGAYGPTAFVTIQEGCDKFCTYCVVPYTRGPELSRSAKDVVKEVQILAEQGVREVCLLGQNVNAYHGVNAAGKELTLAGLLKELAQINGIERLRFTTSHPNNMNDEMFNIFAEEEKVMPYFHLPVQSGSNKILAAMNRNHTVEEYLSHVERLRSVRPDIAMSGDFIVGFPGETEEDYLQTLSVIAEVGYGTAYGFAYSPRPGTPGAALSNQVEEAVKKERLAGMLAAIEACQENFNSTFVGKETTVLVEGPGDQDGLLKGRTPHNISCTIAVSGDAEAQTQLIGEIVRVKVTSQRKFSLHGEQL